MWPFKRQTPAENSNLPEEVQEYYEAERREHIGVAWLLAFVTLVVTVVVIIGLFVGGRWAYRKYAHKNTSHTSTIAISPKPQVQSNNNSAATTNTATPSGSTTSQTPASTTTTTQPKTSSPATTTSTSSAANSTAQSSASQNLTNTGPGDTLAVFIGVSALATAGHLLYSRRKLAKSFVKISNK